MRLRPILRPILIVLPRLTESIAFIAFAFGRRQFITFRLNHPATTFRSRRDASNIVLHAGVRLFNRVCLRVIHCRAREMRPREQNTRQTRKSKWATSSDAHGGGQTSAGEAKCGVTCEEKTVHVARGETNRHRTDAMIDSLFLCVHTGKYKYVPAATRTARLCRLTALSL